MQSEDPTIQIQPCGAPTPLGFARICRLILCRPGVAELLLADKELLPGFHQLAPAENSKLFSFLPKGNLPKVGSSIPPNAHALNQKVNPILMQVEVSDSAFKGAGRDLRKIMCMVGCKC